MRATAGLVMAAAVSAAAVWQPLPLRAGDEPVARYGILPSTDFYPQRTAKEALATAAKLLENKRYEYLAAHLLDPAVVDARVAEKVRALTAEAETALRAARAEQRRNPTANAVFIPDDPTAFAELVQAEAERRAFRGVATALVENLNESPENVKLFGKFARDGSFSEGAGAATVSLKSVPERRVFLKQVGDRWFVEDRQQEAAKPKADK